MSSDLVGNGLSASGRQSRQSGRSFRGQGSGLWRSQLVDSCPSAFGRPVGESRRSFS